MPHGVPAAAARRRHGDARAAAATTARARGSPSAPAEGAAAAAAGALDRVGVPIEPRRAWPTGADRLGVPVKGRIAAGEQAGEGRALARLTDLGWGGTLASCSPRARPTRRCRRRCSRPACACSPTGAGPSGRSRSSRCRRARGRGSSTRSPAGIAEIGRLPYLGALAPVDGGPTGGPGGNSAFRLAGVWDRFSADGLDVPAAGVLLIDDQADSRWTLTVAARALRQAGATEVLPFVLWRCAADAWPVAE